MLVSPDDTEQTARASIVPSEQKGGENRLF